MICWLSLFLVGIVPFQAVPDGVPDPDGPVTAVTSRVAAATSRKFQALALATATQRKRKVEEMSLRTHAAAEKIKRIASERSLKRHLTYGVRIRESYSYV